MRLSIISFFAVFSFFFISTSHAMPGISSLRTLEAHPLTQYNFCVVDDYGKVTRTERVIRIFCKDGQIARIVLKAEKVELLPIITVSDELIRKGFVLKASMNEGKKLIFTKK